MLAMISTYDEEHAIFKKGFMPQRNRIEDTIPSFINMVIDNKDGFFDNLPVSKSKSK
jgi:hypothetical protein